MVEPPKPNPMPIDLTLLETTARAYASTMTSIRGRRVVKLLLREYASFDVVLIATAKDGLTLVLALDATGRAAICVSDGKGPTVAIDSAAGPAAASVRTKHDFLKDSLPVVGREILPAELSVQTRIAGISTMGLARPAKALLRRWRSNATAQR